MKLDDGIRAKRADVRVLMRALDGAKRTEGVEIRPGASVAEAVAARSPDLTDAERAGLRVVLHGADESHVLETDDWARLSPAARLKHWAKIRLRPGAFLVIDDAPQGGGLRSVLQIVVALAAFAIAGPLGGFLGFGQLGVGLLGAGLAFAGQFLVNLLIPLRTDSEKPSVFNSLEGFKNQSDIGGPVPLPVGLRHRYAPKYVVPPFVDVQDDDVYLTAAFMCGYSPLAAWETKIGDRLLSRFDARFYQIERRGFCAMNSEGVAVSEPDHSPFTLLRETVIQKSHQIRLTMREEAFKEEGDDDGSAPLSEPTILELEPDATSFKTILSFPGGLSRRSGKKNKLTSQNVGIKVMIRPITPTDDAEWVLVEDWYYERERTAPFFVELGPYDVPGAREQLWEVSFVRTYPDDFDLEDSSSATELVAIQSILPEYPINQPDDAPFAMVALRVKATNQLRGTLDEFNEEYASLIDALDPATGAYQPRRETGNPADIYRWLATMTQNAKAIPVDRLSAADLADWHAHNVDQDLMFSRIYDYVVSADAAMRDVCAVGRAAPIFSAGKRTISIDRRKDALTAFPLTPFNTWGYEGQRSYKESDLHGWRVKFRDRTNDFKSAIREVVRPDLPSGVEPVNFEEVEPPGVTDPAAAYVWGYKLWLEAIHRPDVHYSSLNWQSRLLEHGDLAALSHRLIHRAQQAGYVESVEGRVVTLRAPVVMEAGKAYAAKFRKVVVAEDGTSGMTVVLVRAVRSAPGETRTLVLTGAGDAPEPGDLAWFGEASNEDLLLVVQGMEPGDDGDGRLTLLDQAPQIFDILDALVVPPWSSRVGVILPGDDRPPPTPRMLRALSGESLYDDDETVADPRRVAAYVGHGYGIPKAAEFRLRHRLAADSVWTEGPWFPATRATGRLDGVYPKGANIRIQARARSKALVESPAWSASLSHVVGQADPVGPVASDLHVAQFDSGIVRFRWTTLSPSDRAQLFVGPADAESLSEMSPIHDGYLTSSPYDAPEPPPPGSYLLAVVLTDEDDVVGEPATRTFDVAAEDLPEHPVELAATVTGATVRFSARAANDDHTYQLVFRRGTPGQSFAAATPLGDPLLAFGGDVREYVDEGRTSGQSYRYWAASKNRQGAFCETPQSLVVAIP
ncbi:hypothetical protein [Chenggangzhangella methanolivorans]|uniref:Phage tail protein n=1 Tax=Chenggangzhangella methanolivorans TaxID=1437009 RepID=A0A9E6R950_9HYPH|nr:hypothetical protein [Chenggangzhangella methanolivorans]QZN99801.1 hypothetical protein K6K41_24580 [Chenggangzhangella methanolivorans]